MPRSLHTLSAILFYVLAGSYFLALLLARNDVLAHAAHLWIDIADLPLLFIGLLFGGLSVYDSVHSDPQPRHALIVGIALPLSILFVLLLITNFLTPSL